MTHSSASAEFSLRGKDIGQLSFLYHEHVSIPSPNCLPIVLETRTPSSPVEQAVLAHQGTSMPLSAET